MRIVLAGGTGFLGSALADEQKQNGWTVTVLTRRPARSGEVAWNPYGPVGEWANTLENADAVVNLAGASIARRWTAAHKREMWKSRVDVTRSLVTALKSLRRPPPVLVNASGVDIYGPHGEEPVTEETPNGAGFLAELGSAWEKEALAAQSASRVVLMRSGVVLHKNAGALPRMALPFRLFVGGPLGSGRQYLPWIHRDDWTGMVRWALANASVTGPINATAPNPVTNREFAQTLGRALGRPAVMPAPAFALRLVLGEMADLVLTGKRVFPDKAQSLGFDFRYPTLDQALRAVYAR